MPASRTEENEYIGLLLRVIDIIIPADDYPSASEAGVSCFLLKLWKNGVEPSQDIVHLGLAALERESLAEYGAGFINIAADRQQILISRHAGEPWFGSLCELVAEGYYSNPGNGANPDAVSWRMIGYEPGLPEGPDGPPADFRQALPGRLWA